MSHLARIERGDEKSKSASWIQGLRFLLPGAQGRAWWLDSAAAIAMPSARATGGGNAFPTCR
jgi:hypothetical protein